jgi:hypothetical protein
MCAAVLQADPSAALGMTREAALGMTREAALGMTREAALGMTREAALGMTAADVLYLVFDKFGFVSHFDIRILRRCSGHVWNFQAKLG